MRGSSWPSVANTWSGPLSGSGDVKALEATGAFSAVIPNELSAFLESIQRTLGADPADLSDIGGTSFADLAALLAGRARYEIRQYSHAGSTVTQAVAFANTARFTSAPKVFLIVNQAIEPDGNETWAVDNEATTGFDSKRNINNGSPAGSGNARTVTYVAVQAF